ncbi:cellulose biosynthetic CelD-like protein [Asticcacaulis biprosthecium C19]|uniref:Cellulose biosynthetic CelD-like protein n=1 Tax=Asticcacaulis biprosthecium C19 TaxID=715226 RepID=F4QRG4_9CAUL|nr:GNAT family N-acetyltransferase [Asticcacaulis biprosthecium]EGF90090.1 cellulose biosynthetic CelD-like protein [Asticcacaulis biprosthecium C19]
MTDRIDIVQVKELTATDEALWNGFVAARAELVGPYFDLGYVQAIAPSVPNSGVARFYDGDQIAGYFAFQKRGDILLPIGAPLSDYHAVISAPDFVADFDHLMRLTRTRRVEFQGLVGTSAGRGAHMGLTRRIADATDGFDHWWATQDAANHKFFKNVSRCMRNVEKDFGGFDFSWEKVTPELMDWTINLKREQYRRSGMHDVFGCRWTRGMLDRLAAVDSPDFGLRCGVLRHQGRLVAVEISLVQGEDVHLWFPAYDPDYGRYSVGILLTVAIIKNTEALGLKRFDFGTGGEDYKSPMTTSGGACLEGEVEIRRSLQSRALDAAGLFLPRERFEQAKISLRRRVKVIRATEITLNGWSRALTDLGRRAVMRTGVSKVYAGVLKKTAVLGTVTFVG